MAVTIVPTVEPPVDNIPPRVRLDVTVTGGITSTTITRQDPDGRIVPVRTNTGDPLPISGGTAILYDYEAPFGAQVWYSSLEDPASVAQATVDDPIVWLIHPGVPVLSTPIELAAGSAAEEEWAVQQGIFWVMGRETPVVHTDGARKAPASTLSVITETLSQLRAMKALLADTSPLLLNVPPSLDLGLDTTYIAIGSVTPRRPSDIGSEQLRTLTLPYTVVARPAGGSQATRTYADPAMDYGSYADLKAAYASYLALTAGP